MLRAMVFVDHMNFNIAVNDYYRDTLKQPNPKLDYGSMFKGIVQLIPNIDYVKTIIFAPEPDAFLMKDNYLLGYYKWVQGMKTAKYLDVVEGRYIARPTSDAVEMDISDRSTYYKVEKGTDINLAIHAITKAQNNAYDVAFILSADTDFISLYRQLKNMGKLVIVVAVCGQALGKIVPEVDDFVYLNEAFFQNHLR